MEPSLLFGLSAFQLLATVFLAVFISKCIGVLRVQYTYWWKKGVPQILAFPFFGTSWRILFRRVTVADWMINVMQEFKRSRYIGLMDFATPALMVTDPEVIKEVAVKSFDNFPDHMGFVNEEMDPLFGKNIFSLKGDRWREMRATLSPSFTASKMKFMLELVSKCSRDFVTYLIEHPEYSKEVECKEMCSRYTTDVIATVAFGISVNSLKDRENEFYLRGKESSDFGSVWSMVKFIMFRLNAYLTRLIGLRFMSREASQFFYKIVWETVKMREEKGIVRPDMIHLMMQAKERDSEKMTIDDMVAQAFIFFLAGFDTSSTAMSNILHELAVHTDVQDRLREEIDRTMEECNGEISYEALSKMEYLDMVVSETLRLYPPVVVIDRVTQNRFVLPPAMPGGKDVVVEPKTIVWFPVYGLHHSPEYFQEPEKFDPERFSEGNKERINPYVYMPFGAGPRKCIGNRFALMEIKILTVHILERMILKRIPRTRYPVKFSKNTFTLQPVDGFWIGLEKRQPA